MLNVNDGTRKEPPESCINTLNVWYRLAVETWLLWIFDVFSRVQKYSGHIRHTCQTCFEVHQWPHCVVSQARVVKMTGGWFFPWRHQMFCRVQSHLGQITTDVPTSLYAVKKTVHYKMATALKIYQSHSFEGQEWHWKSLEVYSSLTCVIFSLLAFGFNGASVSRTGCSSGATRSSL